MLKALDITFLSTLYTYIYTHTLYIHTPNSDRLYTKPRGAANLPALPTQTKQGCAEALGFVEGKDSSQGSLESSSGASTQPFSLKAKILTSCCWGEGQEIIRVTLITGTFQQ